jgi:hypothetical protein
MVLAEEKNSGFLHLPSLSLRAAVGMTELFAGWALRHD